MMLKVLQYLILMCTLEIKYQKQHEQHDTSTKRTDQQNRKQDP